jgi:hypothetical protein
VTHTAAGNRDFAALLDELIAASVSEDEAPAQPTIRFDYLSVAEELHSGRIRVSPDAVAAEYREADAMADALFAAAQAAQDEEKLPSTEPEAIWNELGLAEVTEADELGRRRRAFAFDNHPDRVAPHLRQRAMVRMQIANMLIDEMERRVKRGAR